MIKNVHVKEIEDLVARLCIEANKRLPQSLENCIRCQGEIEKSPVGKAVFGDLCANLDAAVSEDLPICQDTGMAVIFAKIGQNVRIEGGDFKTAVNAGVAKGYTEGNLRCSIVGDPLHRVNTDNNTPAVIHIDIVEGDRLEFEVCPKGFGSENMSALRMFTPSVTVDEIVSFAVDVISTAGSNPCPPIVVGIGIGGDFELCAYLAKRALCRDISVRNAKPFYAELEKRTVEEINKLGIGPQGFGGTVTALAVNIEEYPTHIAGLPVAVNVGCHVTRHAHGVI